MRGTLFRSHMDDDLCQTVEVEILDSSSPEIKPIYP